MEEDNIYHNHLSDRIRRFMAVLVSVLLLLSLIVLVLVGVQSLTAIAAAFTVFALAIVFVLGILGISRLFCCYACDGPVRRSFWFMTPSDASLFANSMPGSTRESIIEIPYPDSTDLPSWTNEQQLQQPPDYFAATNYGHRGSGGEAYPRQETPPPSYKFLTDAGLIADGSGEEQTDSLPDDSNQPPSSPSNDTGPKDSGEQRRSVAIIMDEDKTFKEGS